MENSMLMRVMYGACDLRDEFHRLPDQQRLPPNDCVELAAFDEFMLK